MHFTKVVASIAAVPGWVSSISLASSPEVEGVNGVYFDQNNKQIKSSKGSYDEEAQKRIWKVSAKLTKLDPSMPLQGAD